MPWLARQHLCVPRLVTSQLLTQSTVLMPEARYQVQQFPNNAACFLQLRALSLSFFLLISGASKDLAVTSHQVK